MSDTETPPPPPIMEGTVLHYEGRIYVRPIGRGIVLKDGSERYLDDLLPEGHHTVEIIIRKI